MTEHTFVDAVHRRLKKHDKLYVWKINAAFAKGVPDAYYSGNGGDLWVEYKYGGRYQVSPLQKKWLTDRYHEGRNCWLVIGYDDGVVVIKRPEYGSGYNSNEDVKVSINDLVDQILATCLLTETNKHGRTTS
jgi:hypothetical protein